MTDGKFHLQTIMFPAFKAQFVCPLPIAHKVSCLFGVWLYTGAIPSSLFDLFLLGPVHDEEIDLAGILVSVVSIFIACQGSDHNNS